MDSKRRASITRFKKQIRVDFREYYHDAKTDTDKPTQKGVSLTLEDYQSLKDLIPTIDHELAVIKK